MATADLTAARLRNLFNYDQATGLFIRKIRVAQAFKPGQIAGNLRLDGYIAIKIDGKSYFAQRLAWLWMTGAWPDDEVDHVDRDRSNNRWLNLRPATAKQNNENASLRKDNRSGFTGVTWCAKTNKWRARIRHHDRQHCLGFFETVEQAHAARVRGEQLLFTHSTHSAKSVAQISKLLQLPSSSIATMPPDEVS